MERPKSIKQRRATNANPLPARKSNGQYRIGAVARATGISLHTIRIWERRYEVVRPSRTEAGGRLYSEVDIDKLRATKFLVDRGQAISQVARLSTSQLSQLARKSGTEQAAHPAANQSPDAHRIRQELVDSIRSLDVSKADALIGQALMGLGPRSLALDLLAPLLVQIGNEWASVRYEIYQEHAATVVIRNVLGSLLRTLAPLAQGDTVISATLSGEEHELGALMACVIATTRGYRPLHLGANLPASQIAAASNTCAARFVLLSVICPMEKRAHDELRELRKRLDPAATILLGGRGLAPLGRVNKGIVVVPDLRVLDDYLAKASVK